MEFENFLDSVRKFMIETGQDIQKIDEKLDNLKKMKQDFQDVQKYNDDQTLENARILVLYSNYIPIKCNTAALSKAVSEMKQIESKLPKIYQPKVEQIRSFFKSMKEKIEEIDSVIEEIGTKIKEFKDRKYKITEEEKIEMEMLMLDLKGNYTTVESYRKGAEEVLQSLNSAVMVYLVKEGVLAVAAAAVVGGAGAVAGAGGAMAYTAVTGETMSAIAVENATVGAGVLSGVLYFVKQLYSINCEYDVRMTEMNKLNVQLEIIIKKIKEKSTDIDVADKKQDFLKVQ